MEQRAALAQKKEKLRLYLADIRPLYREGPMRRAYAHVDEVRRAKADACRTAQGKAASLAAGLLADYALGQFEKAMGQPGEEGMDHADHTGRIWCVRYGKGGQPIVCPAVEAGRGGMPLPAGTVGGLPFLSLSHSGDYAVCAIAGVPVGVDIQKRQPVRIGMLRHFFREEEREGFLRRFPTGEGEETAGGSRAGRRAGGQKRADMLGEAAQAAFLRLWTVKESYMKLTGAGMRMGFSNICVEPEEKIAWERGKEEPTERVRVCRIWEYAAPEGYFLSACTLRDGE